MRWLASKQKEVAPMDYNGAPVIFYFVDVFAVPYLNSTATSVLIDIIAYIHRHSWSTATI